MKLLEIGEKLPNLFLFDQNSTEIRLHDYIGKPLVIFFYPKDHTPVCTIEACSFRDNLEEFNDLNTKIFGISSDSPASHLGFANKYQLDFALLSDPGHEAEKAFGVKRNLFGLLAQRVTFIINSVGEVAHVFSSQFNGKKHIKEALKAIHASN